MRFVRTLGAVGLVATLAAGPASAAGFELDEQDVEILGAAVAGRAAWGHNASATWWNPASISVLPKGWNYEIGLHAVVSRQDFRDEGSTDATGGPMLGDPTLDAGETGLVPNLYLTRSLDERWTVGLALNVPFGLGTEYTTNSTPRYFATVSDLLVINLEPVVSYRIGDRWSVGGGLNLQYAQATLANQIDFGSIGAGFSIPGLAPQMNDGGVEIEGDSFAVGFTLGVHFALDETHSFGLAYRSPVAHDLSGTADFDVPGAAQPIVAATGAFVDSGIDARLTLPQKIVLSGAHRVARAWTVLWDASWTDWRPLDALNIEFDNPNQPTSTLVLKWEDSWRLSVGGVYEATERWTFRAGGAWDQAAVPNSTRGPRLPGTDRFWIAAGVSYRMSDATRVHLAYVHVITDRVGIDQTSTAGNLVGSVQGGVDIVSIGVTGGF